MAALAYQLMAIGANFPAANKKDPIYLHLALPKGSSPELLRIWREHLKQLAATNAEGGTVTVDEFKLYKDNILEFKANKVVGIAFPKRPEFIHATVTEAIVWGDANASVALLKSLRLALELSLSLEFGFPFTLSSNLEVEISDRHLRAGRGNSGCTPNFARKRTIQPSRSRGNSQAAALYRPTSDRSCQHSESR
jgi:CRISPR-associated protein Csc3